MYVDHEHNILMPQSWRFWVVSLTSRTWCTLSGQWVWRCHTYLGLFCIDSVSVPCIPLRQTQHRHGAVLCRDDDAKFPPPPETTFFTDKLTHIMCLMALNHKLSPVMRIKDKEKPAYFLGYAYVFHRLRRDAVISLLWCCFVATVIGFCGRPFDLVSMSS
jgi:hypothetical protein